MIADFVLPLLAPFDTFVADLLRNGETRHPAGFFMA